MSEQHPDYAAAPADHRWHKSLAQLAVQLRDGAWEKPGAWAWFVLPHGAMVAMRALPDQHRELRISRRKGPDNDAAWAKWRQECRTFLRHLGCEVWTECGHLVNEQGVVRALYREPGVSCAHCGRPAEGGAYREPLCFSCARLAGDREVAEMARQRQTEGDAS